MLNALYVFENNFGSDIVYIITKFTQNPFTESRNVRYDAIYKELHIIYDSFVLHTKKEILRLYNIIKTPNECRPVWKPEREYILEIQEDIADLHYEMNTMSNRELMELKPRICSKHVLEKHLIWYFEYNQHVPCNKTSL